MSAVVGRLGVEVGVSEGVADTAMVEGTVDRIVWRDIV